MSNHVAERLRQQLGNMALGEPDEENERFWPLLDAALASARSEGYVAAVGTWDRMAHNRLRSAIVGIDPKAAGKFHIEDLAAFTDALLLSLNGVKP